jgi:nitronate monooxygenase
MDPRELRPTSTGPSPRSASVTALLGVRLPVVAAPMAGGPSTPALVVAAARTGSFASLAGGYLSPEALQAQVAEVRAEADVFGVNLFVPHEDPVDPDAYRSYADALAPLATAYDVDIPREAPRDDDDHWDAKVALLLADPVPLVSFTFALPPAPVVAAFRDVGTVTAQTVTNLREARAAADAGVDLLVLQGWGAGAHSGTWSPREPVEQVPLPELVEAVRREVDLPVWAAGGVGGPDDVRRLLAAGAEAVVVGTALLRTDESGASRTHQEALATAAEDHPTVLTAAFSGRPARALTNAFTERFDASAPHGYPALHHLTSPIRKAAAAAGHPQHTNLWAGTGFRGARPGPAGDVLRHLSSPARA